MIFFFGIMKICTFYFHCDKNIFIHIGQCTLARTHRTKTVLYLAEYTMRGYGSNTHRLCILDDPCQHSGLSYHVHQAHEHCQC